jgi:CotH kinase protein
MPVSLEEQQALDSLYAIENVLTVKIAMPPAEWDALRTEQPAGGVCNHEWTGGSRFAWHEATSVEISGTSFPAQTTLAKVGIRKKSYCGSLSTTKPGLHIDFGKFSADNESTVEALIGSRYLTLNNSVQDPSFVRQPLGYSLLGTAGLPHARCNFARVFVNGQPIGQGSGGVNGPGVYVNVEPVMKRYIERNFNGNMKGNLYELGHRNDFVSSRSPFVSTESLSKFDDKADFKFAAEYIAANGLAGVSQMLDLDHFIRVYAMEFFLKHWDGYAGRANNTYLYNDVNAVAVPGVNDIKFKLIPWGIDQTFQSKNHFEMGSGGLVAKLVRDDVDRLAQLIEQIGTYRDTVFSREIQQTVTKPMLDKMEASLVSFGLPDAAVRIATVRQQLRLAGSAGYLCAGMPEKSSVYMLKDDTSDCLHASNTESIPGDVADPSMFEIYHRPLVEIGSAGDLWMFGDLGDGKSVTSLAYGRVIHASNSRATGQGHKYLYTCAANNVDHAEEFSTVPVDAPDRFAFSGYFKLTSVRTGLAATYGSETTPAGKPRIYQDSDGSRLYFY